AALYAKGDVEGAIRSHREAIHLDPKLAQAHTNLGLALYDKGDFEAAIRSYREAIRLDPKLALAYGALGQALLGQGHFRDARQALRRCQQLLPPRHSLQRLAAQLLQQCPPALYLSPSLHAVLQGQPASADPAASVP